MQPSNTILLGSQTGWLNILLSKRALKWSLALLCFTSVVAVFALSTGQLKTTFAELSQVLFGEGEKFLTTVVLEWRLPRLTSGLVFGAALGVSGALFQSLIRNPLGSPDVIGFNTGAYTGALVVIILFGGSYLQIAFGAIVGGIVCAGMVYLLAFKQGIQGFRLIIIGIGVSAMLSAFNTWMMISSSLETSMAAALWGAGSLNGVSWDQVVPSMSFICVALLAAMILARKMNILEMGDDSANMLGISSEKTRQLAMLFGVILTAAVTATAGPISFIALVAPQLAKKLTREGGVAIIPSALMGAMLLTLSDFVAANLFAPNQLPVGIVTISIGGVYLIYLLIQQSGS
ncbi:iron-enterobactin ABC transporter permease [Vibrio gazogenes]|uniref:Iron complex transport system permease protein n=1 Tax=Vibrio gazogenes DSM 21264 = NBRC 103151 TaxID=1123492 RepID=A0A1M5H0T7_VIBGA|nr:iron-enterobactin ABC transporter permease [Vibrio gazogenes]USP14944.1 iron-enterobactin ABC transporter permease [Vibrio gazogenes]SHG09557.1 iron complex transport system permease protein [Vibrio gazogenes DSM 21264] [Vibrio gazogenes DSM 21264 = NBRC 103151]SJN53508.1 Ferric enterobactin transport system permease protein FepG [Vibrio gazogenes]